MKKPLILLLLILIISLVFAELPCQYTQTEYTNQEIQIVKLIETNQEIASLDSLEIDNFVNNTFDLHNNTDYQLRVRITYNYAYYCNGSKTGQGDQTVDINARNFTRIGQGPPCGSFSGYHQNTIKLTFQDNNLTFQTYKTIKNPYEICKLCGDLNCLNDGEDCNKNSQCGGKYCVVGKCNNSKTCPNNDCNCSSDKVQCTDNTGCVLRGVIPTGAKYNCNPLECATGTANEEKICIKGIGGDCTTQTDCGPGFYCTPGGCNPSQTCPNNNCKCPSETIQCIDNTKCVQIKNIEIGSKPICNLKEECKTNYIDEKTSQCAKSPGSNCSNDSECGSGICIRNLCSLTGKCYNNNCDCNSETEVQSIDATFCAKKGAIQLGTKPPSGNALECSTGHISPETGNCAKSKEQEEFELYIMIGITVIILISVLSFIALKYLDYVKKVTPEKIKKIENEKEELKQKIHEIDSKYVERIHEKDKIIRELEERNEKLEKRLNK